MWLRGILFNLTLGLGCFQLGQYSFANSHLWVEESPQYLPIEAMWCLPNRKCLYLEVADNDQEQKIGLMKRLHLQQGRGMWFPFDNLQEVSFWMFNTLIPLDLVFCSKGFVIAIEAELPPCLELPCPSYGSNLDVDGVIELAAGEVKRLQIQIGDEVIIQKIPIPKID